MLQAPVAAALNLPQAQQLPPGWELLNAYQRDILHLTANGLTNAQIGSQLCRTAKAINKQKTVILAKLGLSGTGWHCLSRFVAEHKLFLQGLLLTTNPKK